MDQYTFLPTLLMFYNNKLNKREEQLVVITHWFLLNKGFRVIENNKLDEILKFHRVNGNIISNYTKNGKRIRIKYLFSNGDYFVEYLYDNKSRVCTVCVKDFIDENGKIKVEQLEKLMKKLAISVEYALRPVKTTNRRYQRTREENQHF